MRCFYSRISRQKRLNADIVQNWAVYEATRSRGGCWQKNVVLFSKDSLAEGENRVEGLQIARQFLLAWRALNYFTDCFRQNEEEKNV